MTLEQTIYELEYMKTWSKDLSDDEIEALKFALHELNQKSHEINTREALQTEPLEVEAAKEQNAYNEGFSACKRIMAREKQFNSYCPKCMGKLEPCEDAISYQAVLSILDEVCRDFDKPREAVISIDNIADMLSELPSVQPEQKVGRWIPMHHSFEGVSESYFVYQYMCSECRALSYFRRDSEQHIVNGAICPNCYAKMEEGEKHEESKM